MSYLNCDLLEKTGAQPFNTVDSSIKAVQKSDIYIGIFGSNYSETTIKEYKKAHQIKIPIFVYIKEGINRDSGLQKFIDSILKNNYKYEKFKNNSDLYAKIIHDLESFLSDILVIGIKSMNEIKAKGVNIEKKIDEVKKSFDILHGTDKDLSNIYDSVLSLHNSGKYIECIITSLISIELAIRKKLLIVIPQIVTESFEQILTYAMESKLISLRHIEKIRKILYLKNNILSSGYIPTYKNSLSAATLSRNVLEYINDRTPRAIKWVAYLGFLFPSESETESDISDESQDLTTEEIIDKNKDYLIHLFDRSGIDFEIIDEGFDGESYSIGISFLQEIGSQKLPFDIPHPWELLGLDPYSRTYDS